MIPLLSPNWDLVLIARSRLVVSSLTDVQSAVAGLLRRAGIFAQPVVKAEIHE
jgi:hypothetical protein